MIRDAKSEDNRRISELLKQLGYSASVDLITEKLEEIGLSNFDQVFVAEKDDQLIGLISCHITILFHCDGYLGRITSLVVDENYRHQGIGKLLVKRAEKFLN